MSREHIYMWDSWRQIAQGSLFAVKFKLCNDVIFFWDVIQDVADKFHDVLDNIAFVGLSLRV